MLEIPVIPHSWQAKISGSIYIYVLELDARSPNPIDDYGN